MEYRIRKKQRKNLWRNATFRASQFPNTYIIHVNNHNNKENLESRPKAKSAIIILTPSASFELLMLGMHSFFLHALLLTHHHNFN